MLDSKGTSSLEPGCLHLLSGPWDNLGGILTISKVFLSGPYVVSVCVLTD